MPSCLLRGGLAFLFEGNETQKEMGTNLYAKALFSNTFLPRVFEIFETRLFEALIATAP